MLHRSQVGVCENAIDDDIADAAISVSRRNDNIEDESLEGAIGKDSSKRDEVLSS